MRYPTQASVMQAEAMESNRMRLVATQRGHLQRAISISGRIYKNCAFASRFMDALYLSSFICPILKRFCLFNQIG
jgi:hypothetical protein